MLEIIFEVLQLLGLCAILALFVYCDKNVRYDRRAYLCILIGLLLVVFGSLMDVLDNFDTAEEGVFVGDTMVRFVLENVVGYLGGFAMLGLGFWRWLPSLGKLDAAHDELEKARADLEIDIRKRAGELQREKDRRACLEDDISIAEEWRAALYERSPIPIAHGLINGQRVERNEAFAAMLGYASVREMVEETSGNPRAHWVDQSELDEIFALMRTERAYTGFTGRLIGKDGGTVTVRIDFNTLADSAGQNYYFYAFATDISENVRSAEALTESEKRLRIIMDSMPAGLYLVDMETQMITDVNVGMLALTGYGREDLVGYHCCDKLCPAEKGSCPVIDEKADIVCAERMIRKKDGTELPVIKTVAPVRLSGKDYFLEAVMDISDKKRLEDFKHEVDRIVAHDLKAPVIGVINACRVLLMDEDAVSGETREMLEVIHSQGNRVLRMIGMSQSMYNMEAGSFTYEPVPLDILAIVLRVTEELAATARLSDVKVTVLVDGQPPESDQGMEVPGNELLFESMLTNLLANAIEASPFAGDVTVAIASCAPLTVAITNTGAVPHEVRETFFDKYATSGKPSGTGLGTYSAKLVADTAGGGVDMQTSDEADETTVTVTLPCDE